MSSRTDGRLSSPRRSSRQWSADGRRRQSVTRRHGLGGGALAVQNLVLLVAAEQLGRRFSEHGGAAVPTVARLEDHLTIVEQTLPEPAVWDAAVQRAQTLLGLTPNPLRSASSVGALASEIHEKLDAAAPAVRALPERLTQRAATLRLDDAGQRGRTADEAHALLDAVLAAGRAPLASRHSRVTRFPMGLQNRHWAHRLPAQARSANYSPARAGRRSTSLQQWHPPATTTPTACSLDSAAGSSKTSSWSGSSSDSAMRCVTARLSSSGG